MKEVRPRFPAIDAHAHVRNEGVQLALDVMDSVGLAAMVNLTGGTVFDCEGSLDAMRRKYPDRFAVLVMLDYEGLDDPGWGQRQAGALEKAVKAGASGLKEVKRLGLSVRRKNGALLAIDDPCLDPVWDRCGRLGVPVIIHTTDPLAFHKPLSIRNERVVELQVHPTWVFMKPGLPSKMEVLEGRSRMMARHPDTTFICCHFGTFPEDPVTVARWLEEHPNMNIDLSARFVEIGRHHPEMMRNFFLSYQDRILFGTDTGIRDNGIQMGVSMPADGEFLARDDFKETFLLPYFESMYRYLETDDYYIPPPTPVQGTWPIHGIALPDEVLKKVYSANARRLIPGLSGG